jgi:hypothetical protein
LMVYRTWMQRLSGMGEVRLKSDNLAALHMALNCSSKSPNLNKVGMEIALDVAKGAQEPKLLAHIPGLTNVGPDDLSRLAAPAPHTIPEYCLPSLRVAEPPRDARFWSATIPPPKGARMHLHKPQV